MKPIYTTFLLLVLSLTTFSQGIAIQGVARDNANAAISDTNMTFTFSITKDDNTVLFSETQSIRTDNFGVFSHIVSTGNPSVGTFSTLDFSIQGLRIKVSVNYDSNNIEVYNQPFQYTPYAHYARNGVPTGSIIPFMGTEAPDGWLLCDGSDIPEGVQYDALKTVLGDTRTPNLKGRFLKGAGSGGANYALGTSAFDVVNLKQYQGTSFKRHNHGPGTLETENGGSHGHDRVLTDFSGEGTNGSYVFDTRSNGAFREDNALQNEDFESSTYGGLSQKSFAPLIGPQGSNHSHKVTQGTTATADGGSSKENRPNSFGVNYIIKL